MAEKSESIRPEKVKKAELIKYQGYFNNKLLEKRGNDIMRQMILKETAILNQLSDNRAEVVGCSRFFGNQSVTEESLIKESAERCKHATVGKHVLAIQDTSEINYQSHIGKLSKQDQELGPVGNDKDIGFFVHPVLVLERENGFPLGISDVHVWNRDWNKETKKERNYKTQPIEEKESYRWIKCSENSDGI